MFQAKLHIFINISALNGLPSNLHKVRLIFSCACCSAERLIFSVWCLYGCLLACLSVDREINFKYCYQVAYKADFKY